MTKAEEFRAAVEKLESKSITDEQFMEYMSDTSHWCFVRATDVLPERLPDGRYAMQSQMQGNNFSKSRATVHMTLNHVVKPVSMGMGNWDDKPYVFIVPFDDMVKIHGNPECLATVDSFYIPDPDKELVLPESTYLVQPSYDGDDLYTIGEHEATYKVDHFTDKEIEIILSMATPLERDEYSRLMAGDLTDGEIRDHVLNNEKAKIAYESAKDKKAFLRGIVEEDRLVILTKILRNNVVKLVMDKQNFKYIENEQDLDRLANIVQKFAQQNGIRTEGHSGTVSYVLECMGRESISILDDLEKCGTDIDKIVKCIKSRKGHVMDGLGAEQWENIELYLVAGHPVDFYSIYEFLLGNQYSYLNTESIAQYNPNLARAYKKFCDKLTARYIKWIDNLKHNGKLENLKLKLREYTRRQMLESRERN